jgi:hypothetical protein
VGRGALYGAMETALGEVAQGFDGEDPLLPQLLDAVHVEVELPEPDDERVAELRERLLP